MKDAQKEQRLPAWIEQKHREREELKRRLQDEDPHGERTRAKKAKAAERKEYREEKAKLQALDKELRLEQANRPGPRKKAASVSKAQLLKLGGVPEMVERNDGPQERFIFGPPGETRFIYTPYRGWLKVELDAKPALKEDLKRVLNQAGCGLWYVPKPEQKPDAAATEQKPAVGEDKQKERPDIAVLAVAGLLTCSRDWQDFTALPKSEQEKADLYRAMINVQLAILTTLQVLKRDFKNESYKLQLAFKKFEGEGTPSKNDKLLGHAEALAVELERPPTKKELKARFDSKLPHPFDPSEFSKRLKEAGLSWLKRGK